MPTSPTLIPSEKAKPLRNRITIRMDLIAYCKFSFRHNIASIFKICFIVFCPTNRINAEHLKSKNSMIRLSIRGLTWFIFILDHAINHRTSNEQQHWNRTELNRTASNEVQRKRTLNKSEKQKKSMECVQRTQFYNTNWNTEEMNDSAREFNDIVVSCIVFSRRAKQ